MKRIKNTNFKRYLKEIIKYNPRRVFLVFFMMIILMGTTLFQPQITKEIIDTAIMNKDFKLLFILSGLYLLIACVYSCGELIRNYVCTGLAMGVSVNIKKRLIKRLINLDGKFYSDKNNGELLKIFDGDINAVQSLGIDVIFQCIIELLTATISFIILFQIQPILLFIVIVTEIIAIIVQLYFTKKIAFKTKEMRIIDGQRNSYLDEFTMNIDKIIINKMARGVISRFLKKEKEFIKANMERRKTVDISGGIGNILNSSVTAMVYIIGGMWVIGGKMSIGELIVYTQYVSMLIGPCISLIHFNTQIQQTKVSLDKIYDFEDYTILIKQDNYGVKIENTEKITIDFKNISFDYMEGELILDNFSLEANSGQMIALVGESGCGKSTVTKLLLRLWDTSKGSIMINGENIKNYNLYNLRKNIINVTQDIFLCNTSIWKNITMGNSSDNKNIEKLCEELGIDEFVKAFDNGYDTVIGERGAKLSGGQKQRIAIARALLYDAPIVILDEATSALDNVSQKKVLNVVKKYCKNKVLLVIAHRLTTVSDADKIYILQKGRNAGVGTHKELLKENEFYRALNLKTENDVEGE